MGGQPHRSLPKKRSRTCKDSGFAEQNSSEDMAPISERDGSRSWSFFFFSPSSSSTFWRTRAATWDGQQQQQRPERKVDIRTAEQLLVKVLQGEQQEYWFPFSLWHIYWSRLQYWKTANPMICYLYHGPTGLQCVCTSAKYRHFQLKF